jgi:hypothetical protein
VTIDPWLISGWRGARVLVLVLWALLLAWASLEWSFAGHGLFGLALLPFAVGGWLIGMGIAVMLLFPRSLSRH